MRTKENINLHLYPYQPIHVQLCSYSPMPKIIPLLILHNFLQENSLIYSFQRQHRMTELSSNAIILMWFQTCQGSYIRKLYNTNCKKSCIVNLAKTKKKHKVESKSHFEKYIFEYKGFSALFLFSMASCLESLVFIFLLTL